MGTVERPYRTSHPWITFRIDLSRAGAEFWMLLGEGRSKVDHLALALLKPVMAEEMLRVYLTKGAQATTAIEGNTLSEDEVAAIVAGSSGARRPSQEYLYREVENILRRSTASRISSSPEAVRTSRLPESSSSTATCWTASVARTSVRARSVAGPWL